MYPMNPLIKVVITRDTTFRVVQAIRGEYKTPSGELAYLVQWAGICEYTWEPASNLNCPEKIAQFQMTRRGIKVEKGEWIVEDILDRGIDQEGRTCYLVQWMYFAIEEATWEEEDGLENVKGMIDDFNKKMGIEGVDGNGRGKRRGSAIEEQLVKMINRVAPEEEIWEAVEILEKRFTPAGDPIYLIVSESAERKCEYFSTVAVAEAEGREDVLDLIATFDQQHPKMDVVVRQ